MSGSLHDWIEQEARTTERRKFADLSDAALLSSYEFYRIACGIHEGRLPRVETIQNFWAVWCELRLREESKIKEVPSDRAMDYKELKCR
jgi:hypothetical protein